MLGMPLVYSHPVQPTSSVAIVYNVHINKRRSRLREDNFMVVPGKVV